MSDTKETYYQRHRERLLAQATAYRIQHREKYQEYWKTYYAQKKEELLKKRKEYALKNHDKISARRKTVYYPKQKIKKEKIPEEKPIEVQELNPTVELPQWTMIISPGNHMVTWD